MEEKDRALIIQYSGSNFELRRLYSKHREFEHELERLQRQRFLTNGEAVKLKRLKLQKLRGVERMMGIVGMIPDGTVSHGVSPTTEVAQRLL